MKSAFQRACDEVGSQKALADLIGRSKQAVNHYRHQPIPLQVCVLIEKATGGAVRREELRPDIAWDDLR